MRIILLFFWLERWQWWKAKDRNSSAEKQRSHLYSARRPVLLRIGELTRLEVTVEHGLASNVVFVGDLLSLTVVVFQVGAVDGSNQGLAEVQLVDLETDGVGGHQRGSPKQQGAQDGVRTLK